MEETNEMNSVGPIVATAEIPSMASLLECIDNRLRELESQVGDLRSVKAQAEPSGRKTVAAGHVSVLAKGSADDGKAASVEDAFSSLSIEQRFAVKNGLIRAGLLR